MAVNFQHIKKPPTVDYADLLKKDSPLVASQAKATVAIQKMHEPEVQTDEVIATQLIQLDQLAHLTVGCSRTYNLGNYESVKASVSLTFPIPKSGLEEGYAYVDKWVSERMALIENELKGDK